MESLNAEFGVMLGSASKAKALLWPLLTQQQFWTGISSSALSIMNAVKAVLLDAVAAAVDKLGPLLGAGADSSGLRQQAAEARMDEKGYGLSARNAFSAIDMDKVTAPMVEAANKARPILEGAFADLAASLKNNPHFEEFRRAWNKYAENSKAATKGTPDPRKIFSIKAIRMHGPGGMQKEIQSILRKQRPPRLHQPSAACLRLHQN